MIKVRRRGSGIIVLLAQPPSPFSSPRLPELSETSAPSRSFSGLSHRLSRPGPACVSFPVRRQQASASRARKHAPPRVDAAPTSAVAKPPEPPKLSDYRQGMPQDTVSVLAGGLGRALFMATSTADKEGGLFMRTLGTDSVLQTNGITNRPLHQNHGAGCVHNGFGAHAAPDSGIFDFDPCHRVHLDGNFTVPHLQYSLAGTRRATKLPVQKRGGDGFPSAPSGALVLGLASAGRQTPLYPNHVSEAPAGGPHEGKGLEPDVHHGGGAVEENGAASQGEQQDVHPAVRSHHGRCETEVMVFHRLPGHTNHAAYGEGGRAQYVNNWVEEEARMVTRVPGRDAPEDSRAVGTADALLGALDVEEHAEVAEAGEQQTEKQPKVSRPETVVPEALVDPALLLTFSQLARQPECLKTYPRYCSDIEPTNMAPVSGPQDAREGDNVHE